MPEPTPTTLAGFTPVWLTEELRRSGTIGSDTTVTSVDHKVLGEGEGFMGIIGKLTLSYDGPVGPSSMIAKIPTDVDTNRATGRSIGVYQREVCVYRDLLPSIDIPKPKVFSAIYELAGYEQKLHDQTLKANRLPFFVLRWLIKRQQTKSDVPPCVLLLEDLSDAEVGDQINGGSIERITAGLETLARLQAQTWGTRNIPDVHWTRGAHHISRILHAVYLNGREDFLKQAAPYFSAHSIALFESLESTALDRVERHHTQVPQVLQHGDYRLDNMFFESDDSVAAIIDWQTSADGPVVLDVGYFLISSLPADTPESVVDDLLAGYHAELVANGIDDYPWDRFHADYLDGLLIVLHRMTGLAADLLDLGDGRGVELVETWLRRTDARLQRVTA